METYLVGGAVRDEQLGLPVHERDWVVVGATVNDMLEMGYSQVGRDFPVFLHPETHEEYALARTERKTGDGHTGFECFTDITVSLEDDLLRRDLTINAIAKSASGEFSDPFNGMADLQARKLRHVSDAFREDPLRVLRIARFAARFKTLGFSIADETMNLMRAMSSSGELENLTPERVWKETEKALHTDSPSEYFLVLRDCGALCVLFPEIDALFGVPQSEKHHPEIDTGIHTMMVLDQAALLSSETSVRLAALLHDLGKAKTPKQEWPKHIRHEHTGIALVKKLCKRIKVPRELTDISMLVCEHHLNSHRALELRPATIQKLLRAMDAYRRPTRFAYILLACEADARGRKGFELREYPQRQYLLDCFDAAQKVSTKTLGIENMSGSAIGEAIDQARIEAIEKIKRQSGITLNSCE